MSCEYVREYYGVPAVIGRRVRTCKGEGIIAADRGHYIGVNLDCHKPGHISNFHPTDGIEYLGLGKMRSMTRSQKNFQRFMDADCGFSFAEWMGFGKYKFR